MGKVWWFPVTKTGKVLFIVTAIAMILVSWAATLPYKPLFFGWMPAWWFVMWIVGGVWWGILAYCLLRLWKEPYPEEG